MKKCSVDPNTAWNVSTFFLIFVERKKKDNLPLLEFTATKNWVSVTSSVQYSIQFFPSQLKFQIVVRDLQ